jgi:hypothetical protein
MMIELMMIELSEKQREGASLPGQPAGPACRASLPGLSPFRSFKFGQLALNKQPFSPTPLFVVLSLYTDMLLKGGEVILVMNQNLLWFDSYDFWTQDDTFHAPQSSILRQGGKKCKSGRFL